MFHPEVGWYHVSPRRVGWYHVSPKVGWYHVSPKGWMVQNPQKMTASHVCQRRLLVYTIRAQIVTGLGFIVGLVLMS